MFVPSILPYEALLAPVSPEAPAGVDLREIGDDIDEIIKAGKDDKGSALSDRQGELATKEGRRTADWSRVIALATDALKRSKDLVVAARLTEAILVRHGMDGLREGLWLLRELIERFWDGLYPSMEDGDVEYRAQPFTWLNDQVAWRIAEVPQPEAHRPLAQLETALATVTGCHDEFLALYQAIEKRYGRDVPRVGALLERIDKYREPLADVVAKKQAEAAAAAEAAAKAAAAAAAAGAPAPEPAYDGPMVPAEPQGVADALGRLVGIATVVRREKPQSPLPYRLIRFAQWADAAAWQANPPPQADLSAPATELRTKMQQLHSQSQWKDLLDECEATMATPIGRFWLDIQRYAIDALEHLGAGYAACQDAIRQELRTLVTAFPELPELFLSDFTAVASRETQAWITTDVLAPAAGSGQATIEEPAQDVWVEALARAKGGQKMQALEMLRAEALKAPSGREAFNWRLRLAELCVSERLPQLAVPILEDLAKEIDRFRLEQWEPRELSARVFAALYQCYESGNGASRPDRARDVFARLCRLDIGRAFRDAKA